MLPKNRRIPRKMFPLLAKGAKVFKNKLFLLRFIQGKDKNSRFCFSISKKVAKSAVVRNRMRRAGYRLLTKYIPQIKSNTIALFAFQSIPKNDEEIIINLEQILNDSLL